MKKWKKNITKLKEITEMTKGMSVDERMAYEFYLTHGMSSNSYYGTSSLDLNGFARITVGGDDIDLIDYVENTISLISDGVRISSNEFMVRESDLELLADNLRGCGEIYVDGWGPNIRATYLINYES